VDGEQQFGTNKQAQFWVMAMITQGGATDENVGYGREGC
jgi:hypothetical protein